jgi:RNA polymerase sigma-70 factor (ECF subfamily)
MESTATLLAQVRSGEAGARDRLVRRYLPILQRWASGRLPFVARDLVDTGDLVQVTLLRALEKVEGFEPRHEGAFLFYLRRILLNQIRDHVRRVRRRPERVEVTDDIEDERPGPLQDVLRSEVMDRYDAALEKLTSAQREAVVLRLELGFTHAQVAEALECPTADAARMLVTRGLIRLASEMGDLKGDEA